jgi:prepilin-type N-terminal cleavage/methylation domain-containing protein
MSFFVTSPQRVMKKSRVHRKPQGFTLIEMMIVVLVIAVLSSVAGFYIVDHRRNLSLKNVAYKISGHLHKAKALAIRGRTTCSINFFKAPALNQYTMTIVNETVDLGTALGNVTFADNPDTSTDAFTSTITFNQRGICTLSGPVYVTNQDNYIYRIMTSGAGGISIQMWDGTATWN